MLPCSLHPSSPPDFLRPPPSALRPPPSKPSKPSKPLLPAIPPRRMPPRYVNTAPPPPAEHRPFGRTSRCKNSKPSRSGRVDCVEPGEGRGPAVERCQHQTGYMRTARPVTATWYNAIGSATAMHGFILALRLHNTMSTARVDNSSARQTGEQQSLLLSPTSSSTTKTTLPPSAGAMNTDDNESCPLPQLALSLPQATMYPVLYRLVPE